MWVTGRHPVEEVLSSERQKARRILLSEAVPPPVSRALIERSARAGITCQVCSKEEWERRTGEKGGPGIAAEMPDFRYDDLKGWLAGLPDRATAFLLDGITDPQNLGAILRNARAFGVAGVIVPKDRSCPVTGAVFRASAGAAAHVPIVQVTNLARAVEDLQEAGFWVYAAERAGENDISSMETAKRMGVVLGSEEKGIRKLVREKCDGSVRIAMEPGIDSLNVGMAAGILAFFLRKSLTTSR